MKLSCPIDNVAPLLPHSGQMVLLNRIVDYDDQGLRAMLCLADGNPLQQADGTVPSWMGLELLAQCIGALDGCAAHEQGESVRLGFLLGTRKLQLFAPVLPLNTPLWAEVRLSVRDQSGFAVFDGRLWAQTDGHLAPTAESVLVQAALNVFSPPDLGAYLAQQQQEKYAK